jgi:TP901 family phage tail tape measure protein
MAYVSVKATADANSYQKTMKSMAQEAKALASQWTATQAKAKTFGSQTDILKNKAGALSDKIKLQKEIVKLAGDQYGKLSTKLSEQKTKHDELKAKVEAAKKAYEESAQATGKDSDETKKLKEELSKLENELKTSENSINQTEASLNKQAIAANNAEAKLSDMQGELTKVNKELRDHKLDAFANGCDKAGQKLEAFGQKMMVVSAGIATFATAATKMAVDFEDSIAKVSTIMDTGQMPVGEMEDAIVSLSNETGIAADDIADNVYNAISAGQQTADAVNFVRQSTRLATAGFAESGDTLDLLTTILNAYGLKAEQVTNVSDMLIQTQNLGKTTVAELSSAMGKVIPTANANSVALDQLCAGYAIMTANGVATAETTTYMNSMLNELAKTGSTTDKVLREKTGKSFKELMADGASLADVLAIVDGAAKEQNLSMSDMFSSSEAAKAGLILLGDSADTFNSTLGQMRESTGATDTAFDKMKTTSYDIKLALNELKNTVMQFGQTILTSATPMIEGFTEKVGTLCEWFGTLDEGQQQTIIKVGLFVAAIAPATIAVGKLGQGIKKAVDTYKTMRDIIHKIIAKLAGKTAATVTDTAAETASTVASTANTTATTAGTAATIAHTVAAKAAAAGQWLLNAAMSANPIAIVVLAIAGLVAGFVALYNHSETFRNAVNKLWTTVKEAFGKIAEVASETFGKVKEVVGNTMTAAKETVTEKLDNIKSAYEENGGGVKGVVAGAWEGIKGYYTAGFTFVNKLTGGKLTEIKNKFLETDFGQATQQAFGKVKEIAGTTLGAVKDTVVERLDNIKVAYEENGEGIKGVVAGAWEGIKGYYTAGFAFVDNLTGGKLTEIKEQFASKLEDVKTAVTEKLTAVQTAFSDVFAKCSEVVSNVFETIKNIITVAFMAIREIIKAAVTIITLPFQFIWENCKDVVIEAWDAIKEKIETAINNVKTVITTVMTAIKNVISSAWDAIKDKVQSVLEGLKTIIMTIFDFFLARIKFILSGILSVITTVWTTIKTNVTEILNAIRDVINAVWTTIQTNVTTTVNAIKAVVTTVWMEIRTAVTTVVNAIQTTVTNVFNSIKTVTTSIWNSIKTAITTAIETARNTVQTAVNAISSTVSNVFNTLKSTVSSIWNGIKSAIETPINAAKTTVQNAIDAMKNAFNFEWSLPHLKMPHFSISGSFSLNPPSVPSFGVEWYKTGGIMVSPTLFGFNGSNAMVGGEAGAEAILPLEQFYSRLNRMLDSKLQAIQQTVNVKTEVHTYIDSDEVANVTTEKVSDNLAIDIKKRR